MGIDEAGDQELSSRQIQPLELSAMADPFQEYVHVSCLSWRTCWLDLLDGLDDAVLADIEECVGERFVGTPVDGGDEGTRDEESHLTIREIRPPRNDAGERYGMMGEARNACRIRERGEKANGGGNSRSYLGRILRFSGWKEQPEGSGMDSSTAGLGRNGFTYEQLSGISNHGSQDQRVGQVGIALRAQMSTYGEVVRFDRPQSRSRSIDRVAGGSGVGRMDERTQHQTES